jgi:hypothetical protein
MAWNCSWRAEIAEIKPIIFAYCALANAPCNKQKTNAQFPVFGENT